MKIVKIISEWKRFRKDDRPKKDHKRVQAIITNSSGYQYTKHIEISKEEI